MRLSWFLLVSSSNLSRGISLTHATRRFVLTIIKWLFGSYAPLPQFTPPTFPGTTTLPTRLGGVKIPSDRDALIFSWHHCTSAGLGPQASLDSNLSGTREMVEKGCVGQLCSPLMSDCGTGRSSTGSRGAPVRRFRTKTRPIFVLIAMAGVPSFQLNSNGCEATS